MNSVFDHLLSESTQQMFQRNRDIIRSLKNQNTKTISSQLSKLETYTFLLDNKRTVHSGDILYRPLENFKAGGNFEMYHYGIVFGLGKKNEKLVLDISSDTDVSIKSLAKFMGAYTINDVFVKRKPDDVIFNDIIFRADSLIFNSYSAENLNCEQFVNFCVFDKAESLGLQNAAKLVSSIVDLITGWTDYKLAFTPESEQKNSISDFNNTLKTISKDIKKLK